MECNSTYSCWGHGTRCNIDRSSNTSNPSKTRRTTPRKTSNCWQSARTAMHRISRRSIWSKIQKIGNRNTANNTSILWISRINRNKGNSRMHHKPKCVSMKSPSIWPKMKERTKEHEKKRMSMNVWAICIDVETSRSTKTFLRPDLRCNSA